MIFVSSLQDTYFKENIDFQLCMLIEAIYLFKCVLELRNELDWLYQALVRLVMFWLQIAGTTRSLNEEQDLKH